MKKHTCEHIADANLYLVALQLCSFILANQEPRVYVLKEALPQTLYERLSDGFPTVELQEKMGHGFFADIDSGRHAKEFNHILGNKPLWNKLVQGLMAKKFQKSLVEQFQSDLNEIRRSQNLFSQDTVVKCAFHLSRNGYLLSPHTDTGNKVITIIIYFGDEDQQLVGAGTRFYRASNPTVGMEYVRSLCNDDDRKLLDHYNGVIGVAVGRVYEEKDRTPELEAEIHRFDSIYNCVFESRFMGNQAVLFIKSNTSWHDVRLESLASNQFRRSFVINFYLSTDKRRSLFKKLLSIGRSGRSLFIART